MGRRLWIVDCGWVRVSALRWTRGCHLYSGGDIVPQARSCTVRELLKEGDIDIKST